MDISVNFFRVFRFSEAVSSPHPQVPQQHASPRFTFSESGTPTRVGVVPTAGNSTIEGMDDTRIDLSQLDQSRVVEHQPSTSAASVSIEMGSGANEEILGDTSTFTVAASTSELSSAEPKEAVAGPSGHSVPEIKITDAPENGM